MLKKIIIGFALTIILLTAGIYYVSQNADKIIASVIETQGSRVTQVAVKVDGVDINLSGLKAGIRGLSIANPPGFKTPLAIRLGEISVRLDKNWSTRTVVIDEVLVRAPQITYEIGRNGSNIAAIQKNVENFMNGGGTGDGGSGTADTASTPNKNKDKNSGDAKLVIKDLYIRNGRINVSASMFQGKPLSVALPEIHLKNIGKLTGGASPAEIINLVFAAITKSSGQAAGSLDLSKLGLSGISGKSVKALKSTVKNALDGALNNGGDAGQAAKDILNNAGGALKGLLGK